MSSRQSKKLPSTKPSQTIKLLDGVEYSMTEVLDNMNSDEYYYGFLATRVLSSSIIKMILDSPRTYSHYLRNSDAFDDSSALKIGRYLHVSVLEPHKVNDLFEVVPVKTRTSNAFKEAVANTRKTVLTQSEHDKVMYMVDALMTKNAVLDLLKGAEFEVPAVGLIHDIPFRAKADILRPDAVVDLKTKWHYDIQAVLYSMLFNRDPKSFVFICVDKGSYDVGIFTMTDEAVQSGLKKLKKACDIYAQFFGQYAFEELEEYIITGEI
jgi:hypothetical protein